MRDAFCTTRPKSFFEAKFIQHPDPHGPSGHCTGADFKRIAVPDNVKTG